jgi:predicted porin
MTRLKKAALLVATAMGTGSLPAPALADNSNVTVYGTAMIFTEGLEKDGQGTTTRMTSGTSNLGFRGSEDLGNGLKGVFQIEYGIFIDQNGNPPANNAFSPLRNTHVGLSSGTWGTISGGNWDTPYKLQILDVGPVRGLNPFDNPLLNNPGFAVPVTTTQGGRAAGAADAAFNRRQGNSIMYWSPTVAGFSGRVAYSLPEGGVTTGGTEIDPALWSLGLRYEGLEGLSLRYAYERHKDYFGLTQLGGSAPGTANQSSTDDAHMLIASYRFGTSRVVAMYERLSYENDDNTAGAIDSRSRNAWEIYAEHSIGPHKLFAEYSSADEGDCDRVGGGSCSTSGLGADAWALGYVYNFSKRTSVYGVYYQIDNDENARYAVFPPQGPTPGGTDASSVGLGFIHTF